MSDPTDTAAEGAPASGTEQGGAEQGGAEQNGAEENGAEENGALLSRLRLIEDQPLADRAEALSQLHDELRTRLEAGDAPRSHG